MLSIRALTTKLVNLCVRAVVTRSGTQYQAQWLGDRVTSLLENFQPQGVHFRVPVGAEHLLLAPCGEASAAVMLGAHLRSAMPTETIPEGTGGLHYLGTFGVYIDQFGTVHLVGGVAALDYVALAGKVLAEFTRVAADLTQLKEATSVAFKGVLPTDPTGNGVQTVFDNSTNAVPSVPLPVAATKVKAT